MKAMILAAGLGTRLRPWTLAHPKALVPVGGIPMLERVILSLRSQGFDHLVVNIHHFGNQILEFLSSKDFGVRIDVSDEREQLLDTGGGIVKAGKFLCEDDEPFLIHNVDILSDADLGSLMRTHSESEAEATLLTSVRESSRKLLVNADGHLAGWKNLSTLETRPSGITPDDYDKEVAFSGIHVMSPSIVEKMALINDKSPFPIMDYYLNNVGKDDIRCQIMDFRLIDIGKPETLEIANSLF